jgi:hypothetical protein
MPYSPTTWVEGVTTLGPTNMNHLETGVANALAADAVTAAGTRILASKLVGTDAQPAFRILGSGEIDWGPGGSTAADTNLYRSAAGILTTDGGLRAGGDLRANSGTANQVWVGHTGGALAAQITFGSAVDTNLYRSAAGVLKTDGALIIGTQLEVTRGADLTVTTNAITVTTSYHNVLGSGSTLKTINGAVGGALLVLHNRSGGSITVDSTSNIFATAAAGTVTWANNSLLWLIFSPTTSTWHIMAVAA